MRVELTSYAAAKKLSTYLVCLLFLNVATRTNTLCNAQKAGYSYRYAFRYQQECSVLMTPRPRPTDKSGATIRLQNEVTLQERSLHYYLHLNLSGMFLRRHSVYGMLILSLTGNRIRCIPIFNCVIIIHTNATFVNSFSLFSKTFHKNIKAEQARSALPFAM